MRFNDHLRHKELFTIVKDICEDFYNFDEYNPSICENSDEIEELSVRLETSLNESRIILERLATINKENFEC